jgi:hypothetical protein
MRRICVLLVLGTALVMVPGAAATTRRCRPAARDVIARSGANVLFVRARPGGEYAGPVTVYGCYSARHPPHKLLDFPEDNSGEFLKLGPAGRRARIAGHFVAFSLSFDDGPCEHYALSNDCTSVLTASYSLRTGRRRAVARSPLAAADLALTHAGWFGWLPAGSDPSLLGVDSGGERTLDEGPVDAGSVRATSSGVAWTVAGAQRGALLG